MFPQLADPEPIHSKARQNFSFELNHVWSILCESETKLYQVCFAVASMSIETPTIPAGPGADECE